MAITEAACQVLLRHDWQGNIRALKNVLRTAMVLSGDGAIAPEHLPAQVDGGQPPVLPSERTLSLDGMQEVMVAQVQDERPALRQALKTHHCNV